MPNMIHQGVPAQATDITVDATAGGVMLIAANPKRVALMVQNTGSNNMRVAFDGTAPTSTRGLQVAPGATLVLHQPFCPIGDVKAIREGANSTTASPVEITKV